MRRVCACSCSLWASAQKKESTKHVLSASATSTTQSLARLAGPALVAATGATMAAARQLMRGRPRPRCE
jgi:hypothetical protein